MSSTQALLNQIARAQRYAAAMTTEEARDRYLALAADLCHELEMMQNQVQTEGGSRVDGSPTRTTSGFNRG